MPFELVQRKKGKRAPGIQYIIPGLDLEFCRYQDNAPQPGRLKLASADTPAKGRIQIEDCNPESSAALPEADERRRFLDLKHWVDDWLVETGHHLKNKGHPFPRIKNRHTAAVKTLLELFTGDSNVNLDGVKQADPVLDRVFLRHRKEVILKQKVNQVLDRLFDETGADGVAAACLRLVNLQREIGMITSRTADEISISYPFRSIPALFASSGIGHIADDTFRDRAQRLRSWFRKQEGAIPDLIRAVAAADGLEIIISPPGRLSYKDEHIVKYQDSWGLYTSAREENSGKGRCYISGWYPYQPAVIVEEVLHHVFDTHYLNDEKRRLLWDKAMQNDHKKFEASGYDLATLRVLEAIGESRYKKGNYAFDDARREYFSVTGIKPNELRERYELSEKCSDQEVKDHHHNNMIAESPVDVLRMAMFLKHRMERKGNLYYFTLNTASTVDSVMRAMLPNTYLLFAGPRKGFQLYADDNGQIYEIKKGITAHAGLMQVSSFVDICKERLAQANYDVSKLNLGLFGDDLPVVSNADCRSFTFPEVIHSNRHRQLAPLDTTPVSLVERYANKQARKPQSR